MEFKYTGVGNLHYLEVVLEGLEVGGICWHALTGEVLTLDIRASHRRRGLATALWYQAQLVATQKGLMCPVHSENVTPMGRQWLKSLN